MIKLITLIGQAIESFVDHVGLRNFVFGIIFLGLMVAMFLPTLIKSVQ